MLRVGSKTFRSPSGIQVQQHTENCMCRDSPSITAMNKGNKSSKPTREHCQGITSSSTTPCPLLHQFASLPYAFCSEAPTGLFTCHSCIVSHIWSLLLKNFLAPSRRLSMCYVARLQADGSGLTPAAVHLHHPRSVSDKQLAGSRCKCTQRTYPIARRPWPNDSLEIPLARCARTQRTNHQTLLVCCGFEGASANSCKTQGKGGIFRPSAPEVCTTLAGAVRLGLCGLKLRVPETYVACRLEKFARVASFAGFCWWLFPASHVKWPRGRPRPHNLADACPLTV